MRLESVTDEIPISACVSVCNCPENPLVATFALPITLGCAFIAFPWKDTLLAVSCDDKEKRERAEGEFESRMLLPNTILQTAMPLWTLLLKRCADSRHANKLEECSASLAASHCDLIVLQSSLWKEASCLPTSVSRLYTREKHFWNANGEELSVQALTPFPPRRRYRSS